MMRLAWRNTHRNTRRTLLTVSAVTVAVAALIFGLAYMNGMLANFLDTYARTESGHVRIRKEGYTERERSMPLHHNISELSDILPAVRGHAGVAEALPRIRTMVLVDGEGSNRPGILFGLDLEREEGYFNPAAMVVEGRLPLAGKAEVMVGRGFAREMEVKAGDTLTFIGQTAYRSLGGLRATVTAIGATGIGYLDRKIIVASIDQVQLMADMPDGATEILIFAHDPAGADLLAAALAGVVNPMMDGRAEVLSWRDQGPLVGMMATYRPVMGIIFLILLLMAGLVIVNTMLMTVMERSKEFGMLAALGMRRSDVVTMIVAEGIVIGLIGAFVGGVLGTGVAVWLEHTGMDFSQALKDIELPLQGTLYPEWKAVYTVAGAVIGLVAAGLATLYPASHAIRQSPAELLR